MSRIPEWKIKTVNELVDLINKYSIIGIADMSKIPAPQLQRIRRELRGMAKIVGVKNTLLKIAIDRSQKKNISKLKEYIEGQVAVVFSNENPFRLYKLLEKSKTRAPAKGGEIAPEDIVVQAGDTPFKPGPIVAELQKAGIPAAIEKGKVIIKETKTLVKKGERIPPEVAQALTKLEIYPLIVGMELKAAYEDGIVFLKESLQIDSEKIKSDIIDAYNKAFNLSINILYPTRENIVALLAISRQKAINLSINACIPTRETLPMILSKAYCNMLTIASMLKDGLDDELRQILAGASSVYSHAQVEEEKTEDKAKESKDVEKKEDKKKEEDAIIGLSALFG